MSDDYSKQILTALGRLETKVDMFGTRLDKVEVRLEKFETRMDRLETKQDKMRADIMDRIDRLQHKVDATHDDIAVNFGNTDRVERISRGAADDARTNPEIIRVMQRQIMRLQTDVEHLKGPP